MPILFLLLLCLSSCMLGPKKETPSLTLPTTYASENPSLCTLQTEDLQNWWKQFQDPLLNELMEEVIQKNFDIRVAEERIQEARASFAVSASKLLPSLNFFVLPFRLKTSKDLTPTIPTFTPATATTPASLSFTQGKSVRNFFAAGFDAAWEVDFFGKNRSQKEAAYYNLRAAQEEALYAKLLVTAEVASLYTSIRSLEARLKITRKKIAIFEKLFYLEKELELSGLEGDIQVTEKLSALSQAKSLEPPLQEALQTSIATLAFLLGGDLQTYAKKLEQSAPIPTAIGKVPVGLPSDLIARRPDIQEAKWTLYAAGSSLGAYKAAAFPSFSLTGILGNSSKVASNLFNPGRRFWLVFPDVDWSLFQGGKILSQIQVASSQQKSAAIAYEKTVFNALKEVESALISYREQNAQVEDLLEEMRARKKITSLTLTLFQSGLIDLSLLLSTYNQLFSSQNTYLEAKEEGMISLIALYKALGGGWSLP